MRGSGTNSYTGDTRNRSWQKHQFRAGADLARTLELSVSDPVDAAVRNSSRTHRHDHCRARSAIRTGDAVINGRTVTNPLSTTTRFAYANRGEGQFWTPWLKTWNARVGRSSRSPKGRLLEVALDVFNIANAAPAQQFLGQATQITSANFGAAIRTSRLRAPRSSRSRWQF